MGEQDALRGRLRAIDQQTLRAREQLAGAYRSAAEERVTRVSVRWLCARSGVARSTFYTHFASVEDLAAFVVTADFDRLATEDAERRSGGGSGAVAAHVGLAQVVRMLVDRRELLNYSFAQTSRPVVVDRMIQWFSTYTWNTVARALAGSPDHHVRLVADYIGAGVVHTVIGWLATEGETASGQSIDSERLVEALVQLLPEALRLDDPRPAGAESAAKYLDDAGSPPRDPRDGLLP